MNNYQIILTALISAIAILIISNLIVRFKIYKLKKNK
jgi:ABC-type antimicrobial peptide transport system permease subunit